ncbi:MAG: metallophosphoesterase family protein [Longimicrobiales bacterium]|nr:metallophosphoesterase family protein [Longimicrobiales bacterium]
MLIGVFSDAHDRLDKLEAALALFDERGVTVALFLGDFCSPVPARTIGSRFSGEVHCVFGNGDGDRFTLLRIARDEFPNLKLHGESAELEFDGVRVALTHYPLYGQALARTGDYAAVFSGHTHAVHEERFGDTLWLNPGDIMGLKGVSTCAIWDTASNTAEIIEL